MESKTVWVYIVHSDNKDIIKIRTYGSISRLIQCEVIKIGNDVKNEYSIRKMLKSGIYSDDKYHIERTKLTRSKRTTLN